MCSSDCVINLAGEGVGGWCGRKSTRLPPMGELGSNPSINA